MLAPIGPGGRALGSSPHALGLAADLGSLEPGKKADIVLVDMKKPHPWPPNMPVTRLAHFANAADVDTVIVDGRVLMRGRQIEHLEEMEILATAAAGISEALRKTGLAHLNAEPPEY